MYDVTETDDYDSIINFVLQWTKRRGTDQKNFTVAIPLI